MDPYSVPESTEMFESFNVESVLAVTALSHKEFTVCCYSLCSIILSLEMGMVEDKSLCTIQNFWKNNHLNQVDIQSSWELLMQPIDNFGSKRNCQSSPILIWKTGLCPQCQNKIQWHVILCSRMICSSSLHTLYGEIKYVCQTFRLP